MQNGSAPKNAASAGGRGDGTGAALALALALVLVLVLVLVVVAGPLGRLAFGPDRFTIEQTTARVSTVDGMPYRIHEGHAGPQAAADALAVLNRRIVDLLRALRARYARGPPGHAARCAATARLLARYNPDNIAENSPTDPSGDTSYTIDKGAVVALCLRERGPAAGALHDLDTLTFVALHEMAHIAVEDVDHPPHFWSAFRFLLEEAEAAGVYTSPRYEQAPRQYCGMSINYNPRYDPETPSI